MRAEGYWKKWYHKKKAVGKQVRGKGAAADWEFIGIDGEGSTDADGKSIYQILAAHSRGRDFSIESKSGLSLFDCIDFLMSLPYRKEKLCICGYGFTYDINNMLRECPWEKLQKLAKDEAIFFRVDVTHRYKLRVIYKKAFEIWLLEKQGREWKSVRYVRVYDVFGFFQCSFLNALKQWKIGTSEEIAFIDEYKSRRGENLDEDWENWKQYNALECRLLGELMQSFHNTLKSEDIHLSNWWGAGAIAAYWFKQHNIKEHLPPGQTFGEEIDEEIKTAFFGGQIQRLQVGVFPDTVFHYDLCSAYPWGQANLPSLVGSWRETDCFDIENPWAYYEVDFDWSSIWNEKMTYGALPYRMKNGSVIYPMKASGIYWYPEVAAVLKHWPQCIKIVRGRVFEPFTDTKPFDWIPPLFERRNRLKMAGDQRNIPLKLGLNSLYGKTVQRMGMLDARGRRLIPPYQSYMWGGLITSQTRARVIEAVALNPSSLIAAATDGIYTTCPLSLETGANLGDWMEEPVLQNFELYANGVYRGYYEEDGKRKELLRARGIEDRDFDFDDFAGHFGTILAENMQLFEHQYRLKRFYGYKLAVHRNRPDLFCTWGYETRSFYIVGLDCFDVLSGDTKNVYRIRCNLGLHRRRPERQPRRLSATYRRQAQRAEDLLESEQP